MATVGGQHIPLFCHVLFSCVAIETVSILHELCPKHFYSYYINK